MSRVFIFGAGGHAYVIASFLDQDVTFLVPDNPGSGQMAQDDFWTRIEDHRRDRIFIGIGDNEARKRIFDRLKSAGIDASSCIAPNAWVAKSAEIDAGAVVCAGSVIGARARIGRNTIVNTLSSIDHDCVLGDHSQVTAGVTFGGTVKTGINCFFGIKSAIVPNVTIGNHVVVMAGSLVVRDVESSIMMGGSPARAIRSL